MISFQFRQVAATALMAVLALGSFRIQLHAHGFEGDRFFPPTIATDDPFATDELALPTVSFFNQKGDANASKTREVDVSTEFDKEIFPKFSLGLTETYIFLKSPGQTSPDGFDNLSLSAKYQVAESAKHEFILSVGGEVDLGGTGSKMIGAESYSTYRGGIICDCLLFATRTRTTSCPGHHDCVAAIVTCQRDFLGQI